MQSELYFLKSALSNENPFIATQEVKEWIKTQNHKVHVELKKVPLKSLESWVFESQQGVLRHKTGKFFAIEGIKVTTNWGNIPCWDQPIINQPEIGYLGFITKEFNGILYFLMQAKIEPGNVNHVQLSPTLQATKSNYTRAHKGKSPAYLEYFRKARPDQILVDQLQSEQGARFLRKRNRNIIIKVEEDLPVKENFIWLTLGQIKSLMVSDNVVNMDTRTVISGIPYGRFDDNVIDLLNFMENRHETVNQDYLRSYLSSGNAVNTFNDIITFITKHKCNYDLSVSNIPLNEVECWEFGEYAISRRDGKYFKVIGVNVRIDNREVQCWSQPMIEPAQEGICAFICKKINGILHFIVQAKLECGNFDIIELAPTVQCLTGNYKSETSKQLPFLEYVLNAGKDQIVYDVLQSEEGGRFFKEQNRNMIVSADDNFPEELPDNYTTMSLFSHEIGSL